MGQTIRQILVRYGDNVKGYRVYNPSENTVYTSEDVITNEDTGKNITIVTGGMGDPEVHHDNKASVDSVRAEKDSDLRPTTKDYLAMMMRIKIVMT